MKVLARAAVGLGLGLLAGLVLAGLVVLTRFGPLVSTPRAAHALLLVGLFAVPALAGALIGLLWPRVLPRP